MRILVPLLVLFALAVQPTVSVTAQDKPDRKAIAEGLGKAVAELKNKQQVEETVQAIRDLEGVLDYQSAVLLLGYFDECDRAWDAIRGDRAAPREARGRPIEAYKIANAVLDCIRRMAFPEETLKFAENNDITDAEKWPLRVRMAMVDAIARHAGSNPDSLQFLMDYAKDQQGNTDMRIIAILHLADHTKSNEVQGRLMVTLRDPSWRIRDASIQALIPAAKHNEGTVVLALINALAEETGKLRQSLRDALRKITGEKLGTDPDEWSEWYKNRKRSDQGLPERKGGDQGTRVKVFETETFSDRYVFLIDTSVSMTEKIGPEELEKLKKSITSGPGDEKDKRRPLDWTKINNKLDLAREEIIRSLEVMDPERTRFTIMAFAQKITIWKDELVPTTPENVNEVTTWLRSLTGDKLTNVFGALDEAYDLSERLAGVEVDKRKPRRRPAKTTTGGHRDEALPDTIFLYTDGYATYGKYFGDSQGWAKLSRDEQTTRYHDIMKEMKLEVTDRHRIARITINSVGVGLRQDSYTLRDLASITGGTYTALGK